MDWKDELKNKATDTAQSKAVDSVQQHHGNSAADIANDAIDAAKASDAQAFAQKQKHAAQQRAREVAERNYSEAKNSAREKVTEKLGSTAGQATAEGIDAIRNRETAAFKDQQVAAAKDRIQTTAERKLEERIDAQSAQANINDTAMSVEQKRELLSDMEISYTSKQTQTAEELLSNNKPAGMSVEDKRELLSEMDISYTSKQVQTQDELLAEPVQAKSTAQIPTSDAAKPAESPKPSTSPSGSATAPQNASVTTESKESDAKPTPAPMGIGSLNTIAIGASTIKYLYQIDIDAETAKNDTITLKHNESDWQCQINVADLKEIDIDWVELVFRDVPKSGTFDLIQDPNDGEEPFYIFYDVAYEDLNNIAPDTEPAPPFEGQTDDNDTQPN